MMVTLDHFYRRTKVDLVVPETNEIKSLSTLLPEIPKDMMPVGRVPYWAIAAYRAKILNKMNVFEFRKKLGNPAAFQFLFSNKTEFLIHMARSIKAHYFEPSLDAYISLKRIYSLIKRVLPVKNSSSLPIKYRRINRTKPLISWNEDLPLPNYPLASAFGPRITRELSGRIVKHWNNSTFQINKISSNLKRFLSLIVMIRRNLEYSMFFLYSNVIGCICIIILLVKTNFRKLGIILCTLYAFNLIIVIFAGAVSQTRFHWYFQTLCLISNLIILLNINWNSYFKRISKIRNLTST